MPKVLNKHKDGTPDGAVYVGRGSPWGNPWKIGKDGNREEVIAKFREYAEDRNRRDPDWLKPLKGKDLVCFCAPKSCHAEVLLELANETHN